MLRKLMTVIENNWDTVMELCCLLGYKDRMKALMESLLGDRITAHLWEQILEQDQRTVQHATLSNDWTSKHKDHEASLLCLDTCPTVSQLQNSDTENKERKLLNLLCQHVEHSKALPRSYLFPPDHV